MKHFLAAALVCLLALPAASQVVSPGGGGTMRPLYPTTSTSGAPVGNGADLTEDMLRSYTLPANTLRNNGDRIVISIAGSFAASTDVKTARLRWDVSGGVASSGIQMLPVVGQAVGAVTWVGTIEVIKTGPNAQTFWYTGEVQNQTISFSASNATMTRPDNADVIIWVTGLNATNSVAGSVTCAYFTVDYIPAPSK